MVREPLAWTGPRARALAKAFLFLGAHAGVQLLLGMGMGLAGDYVLRLWLRAAVTLLLSWGFLALERRSLASLGWGGRWGREFAAGALGGFTLMLAVALSVRATGAFHWEAGGDPGALAWGAWLFLAVAFREELTFRGYAFQRLVEALGPWTGLIAASLWFAYAHWGNPGMSGATRVWATLNIGLAGALLGLAFLKTRRLALPIGLHLGWNWTQGSLLGFGVSGLDMGSWLQPVFHGGPDWLTGGTFGLEASLPCAVYTALAILLLAQWKGDV